jgi:glycosyltransferase involved in cell wall biosynthesis
VSPRVALVVTTTATEGADVMAARLATLRQAGWDARLLAKGERWAADPALRDAEPIDVVASDRNWYLPPRRLLVRPAALARYLRSPGRAGALDQRLLELRPDLIHFHSAGAASKAIRLKALLGCRVVVSLRHDLHDLDNRLEPVWEGADRILLPDKAALDRALVVGCPREKVEFLPTPVAGELAGATGPSSPNGRLRLLSAGPITWEQGFEHSVHAVRLLLDAGVDVEYRILGRGEHLIAVSFARHDLGLADRVPLVDPEEGLDLGRELGHADVFVDPAVSDTTSGLPVWSAQGAGIPYVSTPRAELGPDAGIVVERRNARALADAIARLARDRDLCERMGRAGRGHAASGDDAPERLLEIYREVLA